MTREELRTLNEGEMLTIQHKDGSQLILDPDRLEEVTGTMFLYAKRVYSVSPEGKYLGADHFEDPYEFSEERLKRIQCTDEKTKQFVTLEFGKSGKIVHNYPSSCPEN